MAGGFFKRTFELRVGDQIVRAPGAQPWALFGGDSNNALRECYVTYLKRSPDDPSHMEIGVVFPSANATSFSDLQGGNPGANKVYTYDVFTLGGSLA